MYLYCHPQTHCFLSQLFNVVRHVKYGIETSFSAFIEVNFFMYIFYIYIIGNRGELNSWEELLCFSLW